MNNYWDEYSWLHEVDSGEDSAKYGCIGAMIYIVAFILLLLLCVLFGSCKSVKYVSVPEVRTDTLIITKTQRDSIWLHDSIHVTQKQKGDTIFIMHDRWRTKYKEVLSHDTLYLATHDTINVISLPEPQKSRELTKWQRLRIRLGEIFMGIMAVMGIIVIIRLKSKFI